MYWHSIMNRIAIIPARGGSKRIPRKNIREFNGKPIIAYSIEAAINSGLFDEVMVSTDDREIARIAEQFGANVPFRRSEKNSDDFATTADVLFEVLDMYSKKGKNFDYACCIYPTAPFVTEAKLKDAFEKLIDEKLDTVFPVIQYGYPIQRSLRISEGKTVMTWPENLKIRSQDLEARYYDSGQFYFFAVKGFIRTRKIWTDNTGSIVISEMEAQDIDSEVDWRLAEVKFQLMNNSI